MLFALTLHVVICFEMYCIRFYWAFICCTFVRCAFVAPHMICFKFECNWRCPFSAVVHVLLLFMLCFCSIGHDLDNAYL